ncbi:TetR/AcrR family transcriptional regulator [Stackebrandtia nassauensis]|uniref:Transcriptional regulator, TetR family n=1 Tax=Stackebrandtia nassauensis (strain DSM 44728 / CIP 108903 / NRRL B-16338 / NBRC 102104 / LLR-40K-21) TaxID=446470 RepID=D3Q0B6_STANL|nr:TetR/AcrR family transcriptional regulator [Stackebrandtia nassauensis]ADD39780.1 transcriptional regulator, TetR family [Stackebrandtia nassauensis DSM 44728]
MECESRTDGRLERGNAKRRAILDRAVDLASISGLDGLSIGKLAAELGISKSGALLHFGSKLELQLDVITHAAERFGRAVIAPAAEQPVGLPRLWYLTDGWLHHIEIETFPGGCFFSTVGAEFNSRPGRIHDALAKIHNRWSNLLEQQAVAAREAGQLRPDVVAERLVFELDALIRHANMHRQLHDSRKVLGHAREAVRDLLTRVGTEAAVRELFGE